MPRLQLPSLPAPEVWGLPAIKTRDVSWTPTKPRSKVAKNQGHYVSLFRSKDAENQGHYVYSVYSAVLFPLPSAHPLTLLLFSLV